MAAARPLIYRGAVDDQYGLGYSRPAPQSRYLRDALDAMLAHQPPQVPATTAPGCVLEAPRNAAAARITYHARVSRILQQHCAECHRPGGVAPFSLLTYSDVISHAGMIRKQANKGVMPPWFAAPVHPGPTPWANDRTLPAQDKTDLITWLNGERLEGNPADAPLARQFPKEWEIGEPDLIAPLTQMGMGL
ncbi:MAG: hypothetical protein FJ403_13055 [Verrucomicrobia bacterium]|nr:hypothetical protein [Verrucomicrobiota bacterium]